MNCTPLTIWITEDLSLAIFFFHHCFLPLWSDWAKSFCQSSLPVLRTHAPVALGSSADPVSLAIESLSHQNHYHAWIQRATTFPVALSSSAEQSDQNKRKKILLSHTPMSSFLSLLPTLFLSSFWPTVRQQQQSPSIALPTQLVFLRKWGIRNSTASACTLRFPQQPANFQFSFQQCDKRRGEVSKYQVSVSLE